MNKFLTFGIIIITLITTSCGKEVVTNNKISLETKVTEKGLNKKNDVYISIMNLTKCKYWCKKNTSNEMELTSCEEDCFSIEAKKKKDSSICENNIKTESVLEFCILGVATTTGDEKICNEIISTNHSKKITCYSEIAKIKKDITICDLSGTANEQSVCRKITNIK